MLQKKIIAISIGDVNGIGLEIALKAHEHIIKFVDPIYCIDRTLLIQGAKLLYTKIPKNFSITDDINQYVKIKPGKISKKSGYYSYLSFIKAINLAQNNIVDGIVTLPIHKEAWAKAGIKYKGHTDLLREYFKQDAIMMLGCSKMYVALYTEHIPLKKVSKAIKTKKLIKFLLELSNSLNIEEIDKIPVLGLNPHAGDNGVLGNEELIIKKAIKKVNKIIQKELFFGAVVPDIAFSPNFRKNYNYFVAMYHDQGLAPLKALYFDESINVSLNIPIKRSSVDHGTAFDIAYKNRASVLSYINAVKYLS